jgi:hypothetical protein
MAMGAEKSHTIARLASFNSGMLLEPLIAFGGQHKHVDPKTGLALYGPYSLEGQKTPWPKSILVGLVGPASMISDAEQWLHYCRGVLTNDGSDPFGRPHFPGFDPTFQCELVFGDTWNEAIKQLDLDRAIREQSVPISIKRIVTHYVQAIRILSERDPKPNVILCCIPQSIIDLISRSANKEVARQVRRFTRAPRRAKERTEDPHAGQLDLFKDLTPSLGIEEEERGHQNLRRSLKAEAMQFGIPTQLVWPRTFELHATKASPGERSLQDVATRAWNFSVALYYKAGGTPWRMAEIDPETCFLGVSFYREVLEPNPRLRTAMAQAFTASGDGYVLRGDSFEWIKSHREPSPHLSARSASDLMRDVLKLYRDQNNQANPKRIVLHKSSRFWKDELDGFTDACREIPQRDFLAFGFLGTQFYRPGQYPPVRGTFIKFTDTEFALYTSGYIPFLRTYPGPRVPRPLEIIEHYGDSPWSLVLREILALTKMNWNTADFACSEPITLAFAQRVGHILAELTPHLSLQHNYRFFM